MKLNRGVLHKHVFGDGVDKSVSEVEKLVLKYYGDIYFKMEEQIRDDFLARTPEELVRLSLSLKKVKKKNTWYAVYRVHESMKEILREVMKKKGMG